MSKSKNSSNLDELLSAYIDGELTDEERAQVELRLENDPAARELVAEMRALSSTLRGLPREKLAEDIRLDVMDQIRSPTVVLPRDRVSLGRRIFWPVLAIAAALLLIFVQNEQANMEIAKAPGHAQEPRAEHRERPVPQLEAPAEATVSADEPADKPAEESPMLSGVEPAEAPDAAPEGALFDDVPEPEATIDRALDALAAENGELGVVHLTLTDLRAGAERFDELLISNGVQVIDEFAEAAGRSAIAPERASGMAAPDVGVLSSRAASPPATAGDLGGTTSESLPREPLPGNSDQPEMVLVEARPEQIEQILLTCQNDTEAIAAVNIDPTASGTNRTREKQRLLGYQQYARSARPAEEKSFQVTPAQQGVISVLNSIPNAPADPAVAGQLEQGWATKLRIEKSPPDLERVEQVVNERRGQVYNSAENSSRPQSYADLSKNSTDETKSVEQPMRVLFLLHPSEAAK